MPVNPPSRPLSCRALRWKRLVSTAIAAVVLAHPAWAQSRSDMRVDALLETGEWLTGDLVGIDAGRWRVGDREVAERTIIAFTASQADNARSGTLDGRIPAGVGVLELWQGQQLPGTVKVQQSGTVWEHRWIGSVPLVIDRVSSLRLRGRKLPDRRTDSDAILLANGDVATGFVESLGTDLVYEPSEAPTGENLESARRITLDRVAAVVFAAVASDVDPAARADSMQLTTADGSRVLGRNLRFTSEQPDETKSASATGGWSFELADPELASVRKSDTSDNAAANVVAGVLQASRLRSFAVLGEPTLSVPDGSFHYGFERAYAALEGDARLPQLSRLRLAGPVVADFPLARSPGDPNGPVVFTAEISLEQPMPADARVELTIRFGSTDSEPIVLDARNPRRRIAVTDPSGAASSLTIRLDDGGNGIAGDTVLLERACLISPAR